ncbi:ABC transporter substrate-binding protein [Oscillospiraceae bacterium MB08-C2-2]|nr:ABC transporter substrate-binding protein [Oscillospiraceae bacterium MB08-C2-2]
MIKKTIALFMMVCLVLSLGACGSTSSGTPSTPGTSGSPDASGNGEGAAPARKESIVSAAASEADLFFMYNTVGAATNMDEVPILHNVYDTLVKLNPDNSITPLLAESWEISEDGMDYTMKIRQGVTFHNGYPLTVEDVAFTLNYGSQTPGATSLMFAVDNCEIIDDSTVVIHLKAPFGGFLNSLASRYGLVVSKKYFDEVGEEGYAEKPVGTGPYIFADRTPGDSITLEAFPDYWGGEASIKTIYHKVISDPNAQIMALENGEIDVLINTNIAPLLKLPESSPVKYKVQTAASVMPMHFNMGEKAGITKDINFRRAVQYAIDKEEINIGTYEGYAQPAPIVIVPGFTGYPGEGNFNVIERDVEKAKEFLKAANYNGEEFSICVTAGTRAETTAQIIQGQLIEVGINCTVNAVDSVSWTAITRQSGDFGAHLRPSSSSTLDADIMYFNFNSTYLSKETYHIGNHLPELDELLVTGRTESDAEKRREIYAQAANIVTDQALAIPTLYDMNVVAFNEKMNGVEPGALVGLYYMHDWS